MKNAKNIGGCFHLGFQSQGLQAGIDNADGIARGDDYRQQGLSLL
jgi:hypothetical protein